jgi:hypothetical protein
VEMHVHPAHTHHCIDVFGCWGTPWVEDHICCYHCPRLMSNLLRWVSLAGCQLLSTGGKYPDEPG